MKRFFRGALLAAAGALFFSSAAWPAATLTLAPARGLAGTSVKAEGAGLAPGTQVRLLWHTAQPVWQTGEGHFYGYKAPGKDVFLGTAAVDSRGKTEISFSVPEDFGYLHDVTLESSGKSVAHQGFLVVPSVSVRPSSGPVGTPIHITMKGLGYGNYEFLYHLLYDNRYTGMVTALTTRGTAEMVIPATGAPGLHGFRIMRGAVGAPYLNGQQAPTHVPGIPDSFFATFRITDGSPVLPSSWKDQRLPREPALQPARGGARIRLNYASGSVGDPIAIDGSGFPSGKTVTLTWTTVVGNRINRRGWESKESFLTRAATDRKGSFHLEIPTPADLGGVHRITASAGKMSAAADYTITPNVVSFGPPTVTPGEPMQIHLRGIGWTETENIITMVHDNAYLGYACGFNSQGDVLINFRADTRPGWHFIDLYPAIYKGKMKGINADPFRLAMLNVRDHPGAKLPAFHLAYRVEKNPGQPIGQR